MLAKNTNLTKRFKKWREKICGTTHVLWLLYLKIRSQSFKADFGRVFYQSNALFSLRRSTRRAQNQAFLCEQTFAEYEMSISDFLF